MATYAELLTASESPTLINKVRVAVVISAETVRTELASVTNHAARLAWAKSVYIDPDGVTKRMLWAVLAQNKGLTAAQLAGATDAAVQNGCDAAVDVFAV